MGENITYDGTFSGNILVVGQTRCEETKRFCTKSW